MRPGSEGKLRASADPVAGGQRAGIAHLVYVSVPQPSPVMKAYVQVRAEEEAAIRRAGLTALDDMVAALVQAVEHPPPGGTIRIVGVDLIARRPRSTP